ncbi:MAG: GNAT family N-acyltransferase [Paracoccus sp. (in: a-proteobacteria)]|nr:GNAT family N-acyltransferase [Paracoccus sp. (in: a-proteobacteria)]
MPVPLLEKGRFLVRLAETPDDIRAAQRLRWLGFMGKRGAEGGPDAIDADDLDAECAHVLVEDRQSDQLIATFRFRMFEAGTDLARSYSARYYRLSIPAGFTGPMVEMGRFCLHPAAHDPDIVRVAWGAMTRFVDDNNVALLFGCSSFTGTDTASHEDAFAMLKERYLAPRQWLPRIKAPKVFRFARALRLRKPDPRRAMATMPPLLRSYLAMGGWVSDHAVVDEELGTLHVFTGLEIAAIPPARKRLLRAVAG